MPILPVRCIQAAIILVAALFSSCAIRVVPTGTIIPSGTSKMIRSPLQYRDAITLAPLPGGDIVLARTGQRENIHLIRLNDSLQQTAEYLSPVSRIQQRPLGMVPRDGMVHMVCAEYLDRDSMSVVLRRIDPASMKEQEMKILANMPRQLTPHYRSTYALAFSPDSSKALAYTFDLHQVDGLQPMIDLVLIDFQTQRGDTVRLPAPISDDVRRNLRGEFSLQYIAPEVLLTNDDRAYVLYHRSADSIRFVCYDIPRKTFTHSSVRLSAAPCPEEITFFCNPRLALDQNGNLYAAVRSSSKDIIDGVIVAKFDGRNSAPLYIRNIPIPPSLLGSIKSVPGARSLTIVGMIPDPLTGGGILLMQPRSEEERTVEEYVVSERKFSRQIFYLFGDIIGLSFDAEGNQVWGKLLASNLLTAQYNVYPHILARRAGDFLEVAYAGDDVTAAINIYSIKVSRRTGDVSPRRQILQYKGEVYFDFQRTLNVGTERYVWYKNTSDKYSPELIRTWFPD